MAAKAGKVYLGENICAQALVGKRFSTLGLGMPLQKGARITTTAEVPSSPLHPGHIPYHCRSGTITTFIATAEVVSSPLSLPLQKWYHHNFHYHCRSGIATAEVVPSPFSLPLQKWDHHHFHYHCRSGIISPLQKWQSTMDIFITTAEVASSPLQKWHFIMDMFIATAEVVLSYFLSTVPLQKWYIIACISHSKKCIDK